MHGDGLGVGGLAAVVAGVVPVGVGDGQPAERLLRRLGLHADAASLLVVVDHGFAVVPEHITRWPETL